jgi:hypothetical protein
VDLYVLRVFAQIKAVRLDVVKITLLRNSVGDPVYKIG